MNSQVSQVIIQSVPSLGLKEKNGLQFIPTLYELDIKTVHKEKGEKKKKKEIDFILISLLRWTELEKIT